MSPSFGLIGSCGGDDIPLQVKSVHLEQVSSTVKVFGFVAHIQTQLVYKNTCGKPLEVCYRCPVEEKAAIYKFEAKVNERIIKARCMEKKSAEKEYQKAVEKGQTAIFAAEDNLTSDLFYMKLGNLPPDKTAELSVSMVLELPVESDGGVFFALPTIFTPRYCPAGSVAGPSPPQPATNDIVIITENKYNTTIEAYISGKIQIEKVASATDDIKVVIDEDGYSAKITQNTEFTPDHDWTMRCYYRTPHIPHVLRDKGERSETGIMHDDILMLNFFPEVPLEAYSPHNEIIFLVDRSGSMGGERIAFAKSSLLMFLKSLPQGCRFNIVSFGSTYSKLFSGSSQEYTEKTLKESLDLHAQMDSDMGGTEIYQALKSVYDTELTKGYARQLLLLTDGDVWDLNRILDLVKRHQDECRVFTIGVGSGASTALVRGMAEAGRGRCEMVLHAQDMQPKVMGLLASMLQESVLDITAHCTLASEGPEPEAVRFVPKIPPVIFGGQHLISYARVSSVAEVKSIELEGTVRGLPIKLSATGSDVRLVHDENKMLHRLAAKAQIKMYQMQDSDPTEETRERIVALSESSGVVSRYTAFVGIDQDTSNPIEQQMKNFCSFSFLDDNSYDESDDDDDTGFGLFDCSPPVARRPMAMATRSAPKCMMKAKRVTNPIDQQMDNCRSSSVLDDNSYDESDEDDDMGYGLFDGSPPAAIKPMAMATRSAPRCMMKAKRVTKDSSPPSPSYACTSPSYGYMSAPSPVEAKEVSDKILQIISAQEFDGSWKKESVEPILELEEALWEKIHSLGKEDSLCESALMTALVLAFLKKHHKDRFQEWTFVATKGTRFLESKNIKESSDIWKKLADILQ